MVDDAKRRSNDAVRAARYRARKKEKLAKSGLAREEASTGTVFQLELEDSRRQNSRLEKQVADLQHQMQQLTAALMANAGGGVPQFGVNGWMPAPPVAQPLPFARPQASHRGPAWVDPQKMFIDHSHDSRKKAQ